MANTLLSNLRILHKLVKSNNVFDGVLYEASGAPTAATPPNYMFYADSDTEAVYINSSRVSADGGLQAIHPTGTAYVQVVSADALTNAGETLTTANV